MKVESPPSRLRTRGQKVLLGVGCVAFAAAFVFVDQSAQGKATLAPAAGMQTMPMGELHMDAAQALLPLGDLLRHHHDVLVNGQHLSFTTSVVPGTVGDVLDRVSTACHDNAVLKGAASQLTAPIRQEEGGVGAVICPEADPHAFEHAAHAIMEEGNMPKSWGPTHYSYAQPSSEKGKTLVLSVWSDEPVDFDRIFAVEGDAPGSDVPNAARPLEGRRVLTASADRVDYTARLYETPRSMADVKVDYDAKMKDLGWDSSQAVIDGQPNVRNYERDGRELAVEFQPQNTGSTIVAMSEYAADKDIPLVPVSPLK